MAFPAILGELIGAAIKPISDIIGEVVVDKDKANELTNRLSLVLVGLVSQIVSLVSTEVEAAKSTVVAEMQGESGVQRSWRPHLMYMLMGMILFNTLVVPLTAAFTGVVIPVADAMNAVSEHMWDIIQIGLGGYIGGRSLEKIATTIAPILGKVNGNQ